MKILSWNVAGIRAVLKKNALDFALKAEYDILCFQETKAEQHQVKNIDALLKIYPHQHWNHSQTKKGYSGTAIWSKVPFVRKFDPPCFDQEGRVTTVEYPDFILITVYTPNSKGDLSRLPERVSQWDPLFRDYCNDLRSFKPVVVCGDLNVIHEDIDIYQPEKHKGNVYPGYTVQERSEFRKFLHTGFLDAFRMFNKDPHNYTWWSYMHKAREKNIGWRLDYFLLDTNLAHMCTSSTIEKNIMGSDHCPITLTINFPEEPNKTEPITIVQTTEQKRRRSYSYPTPPDVLEMRKINEIKKPVLQK